MNIPKDSDETNDKPEGGEPLRVISSSESGANLRNRTWSEWWQRLKSTPLSDLARGHLHGRLDSEQLITDAGFSESVTTAIRKTWREYHSHHRLRMLLASSRFKTLGTLLHQLRTDRDAGHTDTQLTAFLQRWLWERTFDRARWTVVVQSSSLPQSLQRVVIDLVNNASPGRFRARRLTQSVVHHFEEQLASGIPHDEIITQWSDVISHPAFTRLTDAELLLTPGLPIEVSAAIDACVRGTRLWRREQIDVAWELVTHFQDGLKSGMSASRLMADFGDLKTAATLIRRARLRCRPLAWRMARRSFQAMAIVFAIGAVGWTWLFFRFMTAKPVNVQDIIGDFDARSRLVPEADRAWPFYRRAISSFTEYQNVAAPPEAFDEHGAPKPEWAEWLVHWKQPSVTSDGRSGYMLRHEDYYSALDDVQKYGSNSKAWQAMLHFRNCNSESLELTLEGSTKSNLGFIYRDDRHNQWMNPSEFESFLRSTKWHLCGVLLPHIQHLSSLRVLLVIEFHRALENSDRTRILQVLNAERGIAEQLCQSEFAISNLSGHAFRTESWKSIRTVLERHGELLTDEDLRELAHRTAGDAVNGSLEWQPDTRRLLEDWIRRLYSEDENGDGQLTTSGYQLLLESQSTNAEKQALSESTRWQLAKGAAISGLVASRAEMMQKVDQYCDLLESECELPLWQRPLHGSSPAKAVEYIQSLIGASTQERMRYLPIISFFEPFHAYNIQSMVTVREHLRAQCDAVLVSLALELHHRRHGSWPERLSELVPHLLPAIPVDRYDGQLLRYRLVDGQPLLYSVSFNRIDDGGLPADAPFLWQDPAVAPSGPGDWILYQSH